jgi:predicted nucleic acid-binding protein
MDRLVERLRHLSVIGLDTAIFIYHFEENQTYLGLTRELFSSIEMGERTGVTSAITLMEIIVKPLSLGRQDVAQKYEALLANFPNLTIAEIDRDVIRQAARLRAKYRIRPPDALQASVSLIYGAHAFITNDRLFERLRDELDVIILDDFIKDRPVFIDHTK